MKGDSRFSQLAVMFTDRCFLFLPRLFTAVSLLLISRRGFASTFKADTRHDFYRNNFQKPLIGNLSQQLFHGKE